MPRMPLSAGEKRLHGSKLRPRKVAGYIAPRTAAPSPPRHLKASGRAAWSRWWETASWLTDADDLFMSMLCEPIDMQAATHRIVEREGMQATGSKGQPVTHPAVEALLAIDALMLKLMEAGGFTPLARRRLAIETRAPAAVDEFESFLSKSPG